MLQVNSALGKASDVSPGLCSCAQQGLSSRPDTPSGRATPIPWPPELATAAAPTNVSLHLIALCVPALQLLDMIINILSDIETYA